MMGKLGGAPFYKKVKINFFPFSNPFTLNAVSSYTFKDYSESQQLHVWEASASYLKYLKTNMSNSSEFKSFIPCTSLHTFYHTVKLFGRNPNS